METTTTFDLNQAIQRWREGLAASPAFRNENLDELEAHLRDSIESLHKSSLSVEEAFLVAARRLGKDASLETEFKKINESAVWLDRILWMLIGIQAWGLVSNVIGRVVRGVMCYAWGCLHYDFAAQGRAIPVTFFFAVQTLTYVVSLGLCWWLVIRKGHILAGWIQRYLHRPSHLLLACFMLWLVSMAGLALSQIVQMLPFRAFGVSMAGELNLSLGISTTMLTTLQTVTLIALTLYVARKRIYLSCA